MFRFWFIMVCFSIFALPCSRASGQEIPIFDAHVHYSQPDWSVYPPEAILKLFDQAGVKWAVVSSTPDDGTTRLFEYAPDRIIPFLRPYRTRGDMSSWTQDPSILPYVEKRLQKGTYRGIGEFHLPADQVRSDVVKGFGQLALQYGIFLYAHTDDTGVEGLLRSYPKVKMLWAHAGMSASPETVSRLLDNYPMLFVELSIRGDIASANQLDSKWKALFLRHPDRFMVGSDTWITSRWESFVNIQENYRRWLSQLPKEIAEKMAYKNGLRLILER
jgi:hypothetical protein